MYNDISMIFFKYRRPIRRQKDGLCCFVSGMVHTGTAAEQRLTDVNTERPSVCLFVRHKSVFY